MLSHAIIPSALAVDCAKAEASFHALPVSLTRRDDLEPMSKEEIIGTGAMYTGNFSGPRTNDL